MRLTNGQFRLFYLDAADASIKMEYITDACQSTVFPCEEFEIPGKRIEFFSNLYDIAHMSMRDVIARSGMTQREFAERFCIPKRTVENWCGAGDSRRECPDYVKIMVCELLHMLDRNVDI